MKTVLGLIVVLFSLGSVGCDAMRGFSEFEVSVSNRNSNTIMFYANGVEQGPVGAGYPKSFIIKLRTTGGSSVGPSAMAQVTFVARDVVTGKLSRERAVTLTEGYPYNVEWNAYDFY